MNYSSVDEQKRLYKFLAFSIAIHVFIVYVLSIIVIKHIPVPWTPLDITIAEDAIPANPADKEIPSTPMDKNINSASADKGAIPTQNKEVNYEPKKKAQGKENDNADKSLKKDIEKKSPSNISERTNPMAGVSPEPSSKGVAKHGGIFTKFGFKGEEEMRTYSDGVSLVSVERGSRGIKLVSRGREDAEAGSPRRTEYNATPHPVSAGSSVNDDITSRGIKDRGVPYEGTGKKSDGEKIRPGTLDGEDGGSTRDKFPYGPHANVNPGGVESGMPDFGIIGSGEKWNRRLIKKPLKLKLPEALERSGKSIKASFKFCVRPDGTVSAVVPEKISGAQEKGFESVAMNWVKNLRFNSLPKNVQQVEQWGIIPMKAILH